MTPESQQKILNALKGLFIDQQKWVDKLGHTTDQLDQRYASIIQENGTSWQLISDRIASVFPMSTQVKCEQISLGEAKQRFYSEEFANQLLAEPEPSPADLAMFLKCLKEPLANLRNQLLTAAKAGPRHKRGGRPKELPNQEIRKQIRNEIKMLRKPGVKLHAIYLKLGRKYNVSPSTIKRIRAEKEAPDEASEAEE